MKRGMVCCLFYLANSLALATVIFHLKASKWQAVVSVVKESITLKTDD